MNITRNIVYIYAIAAVMTAATTPSVAQTLSLGEIQSTIRQTNPTLRMYDADIRAMDEAAEGAKSWMPPEVSTGLWMAPYDVRLWRAQSDGMGGTSGEGMGQYMLGVQQMFPNPGRQDADYKYMIAMSSVERERKGVATADLVAQAGIAYYTWLIDKKKLEVLRQNEQVLQFMIKNAELRYKNGREKISAYYKAMAAVGIVENMRRMIQSDMAQRRITLNTLMNRDKSIAFDIDSTYAVKNYGSALSDTSFIAGRSDIKAVTESIRLAGLQQDAERAKLGPEFGLRYEHMFGFGGQTPQYTLMVMMRLPFVGWASRMSRANVESLRWREEALAQQRQMFINEATGMAAQMRTELEQQQQQVKRYEENILPALQRNYQTMQLGYEQNTEELFMLYDAWETLNMTQVDYLDQLRQLLLTQVALDRILEIR